MSGNVKFNAVAPALAKKESEKAQPILPHDLLLSLHGRRVLVFLSYKDHELEGLLTAVDVDKGDVFLEEMVHYVWSRDAGQHGKDGTREELQRCQSAMVSSRYIEMIAAV